MISERRKADLSRIKARTAAARSAKPRVRKAKKSPRISPCMHIGAKTGEKVLCPSCGDRKVELFVFGCDLHTRCVRDKQPEGIASCKTCADYSAT